MPIPSEQGEFSDCTSLAECLVKVLAMDGLPMVRELLDGANLDKMTLRACVAELTQGGADEIADLVTAAIPKAKRRKPEWYRDLRPGKWRTPSGEKARARLKAAALDAEKKADPKK
jgi:hypothetical protein